MSKAILAGITIFALLAAIISMPMMHSADAATTKKTSVKKDTKAKPTTKATKPTAKTSEIIVEIAKGSSSEGCDKGNKCYLPYEAKVATGKTVTWVNKDSATHTASSGVISKGPDGKFDTGLISAGEKFSQKFEKAGTYDY